MLKAEFLMKKHKVDWIKGYGVLKGGGKVEVTDNAGAKTTIEAKNIIIATGSVARMLPGLEPDSKTILTNIEILDLTAVPKSMAIIGAGAVGVEFASIFNRFGSKVTILEMLPRLVPIEDEEVSKELERYFRKTGIRCETGAKAESIENTPTACASARRWRMENAKRSKRKLCLWRSAASLAPIISASKIFVASSIAVF
jgi:dihydrolipoamide dehydrogenase